MPQVANPQLNRSNDGANRCNPRFWYNLCYPLNSTHAHRPLRYPTEQAPTDCEMHRDLRLPMNLPTWLQPGIDTYGYWVILLAVAIESMGVPFPGETALVAGAVYSSTQHTLNIALVIAAAAAGAILGDNIGYSIGKYGGYPLLQRILRFLHLGEDKLLYTERYFESHGDKTVFFGRFLAILRTWAAFLAGANHMRRRTFFIWNAAGGILWATVYGLLGFFLGDNLPLLGRILKDLGIFGFAAVGVVIAAIIVVWVMRHRRQSALLQSLAANPATSDSVDSPPDSAAPPSTPSLPVTPSAPPEDS
jgi:membrane protein DedA with SNARE-associated domain